MRGGVQMKSPNEEVSKKKDSKSKVPRDEVIENEVHKERVRRRSWVFTFAMTFLAAIIGVLVANYILQKSAHRSPSPPELYNQALRLWDQGACSDALAMLDEIISKRPDYVDAYNTKGRIYMDCLKQYQNAVDEFKRGLEKDPKDKYLLYNLGLAYAWLGDIKQAMQWNQEALDHDQDFIIAIYNQAINYVDYGKEYKDTTYYFKAIDLYENVINRDQEFVVSAMFNLADLYARLAEQESDSSIKAQYIKNAVELLDKAIEKEGPERLKKVTGEIYVPYGEDLKAIYSDPGYKKMIEKWKSRFSLY
jgi:tetratricopeptide (TPR) repeat protein